MQENDNERTILVTENGSRNPERTRTRSRREKTGKRMLRKIDGYGKRMYRPCDKRQREERGRREGKRKERSDGERGRFKERVNSLERRLVRGGSHGHREQG